MKLTRVIIHADGASRGNPGLAAIGATLKDEGGRVLAAISQRIGRATNNQAEYQALIAALEKAISLGASEVDIYLDSELVVRQLTGRYRVKSVVLKPLYRQVKGLQGQLVGFTITHIPRQQNAEADNLANLAFTGPG
ncbi:MAG: ribonuclease HI family protein [Dehalococcoidales bacterium]|nr:ribonuclease HI family protein [Dehalococcoidales bacterium]